MWVRLNCLLRRRHHHRLRISKGRMYMECADCGSRSQGWEMGPKARPLIPPRPPSAEFRLWIDDALPPAAPDSSVDVLHRPAGPPDELRLQLDS